METFLIKFSVDFLRTGALSWDNTQLSALFLKTLWNRKYLPWKHIFKYNPTAVGRRNHCYHFHHRSIFATFLGWERIFHVTDLTLQSFGCVIEHLQFVFYYIFEEMWISFVSYQQTLITAEIHIFSQVLMNNEFRFYSEPILYNLDNVEHCLIRLAFQNQFHL